MTTTSLRIRQHRCALTFAALGAMIALVATPTERGARADDGPTSDRTADPTPERAVLPAGVRVIITEIMYNPASDERRGESEWVEIANLGTAPIEMVDWRLDDEDTRPADQWGPFSATLLPGQVAVLINGDHLTEEEFRQAWDEPESAAGSMPYLVIPVKWGSLANDPSPTNEILVLRDAEDRIVSEVNFQTGHGWPRIVGIGGPSIFLTDLDAVDLNDGSLWKSSVDGEDGARAVRPTPIFNGADVGSPGRLPKRRPAAADAAPATPAAAAS